MNIGTEHSSALTVPSGYFRRLGVLHLHIDAGYDADILNAAKNLSLQHGVKCKVRRITKSISGPQRQVLRELYAQHTPGAQEEEDFHNFATIDLTSEPTDLIVSLLKAAGISPGCVVEVERVVATHEYGSLQCLPFRDFNLVPACISSFPAESFPRQPTIEMHHGFEVPKEGGISWDLTRLANDLGNIGLSCGGWFLFEKEQSFAYRSNSFIVHQGSYDNYLQTLCTRTLSDENKMLATYLRQHALSVEPWSIAEAVLAINKTRQLNAQGH